MENSSIDYYDLHYFCDDFMDFSIISAVFFIVIFIISVTGNSLILFALICHGNLKNAINLFILNLTCSNLVFTVTLPFWAFYHLRGISVAGEFGCIFLKAAFFIGVYSSVILLTAVTVEHFITMVLNKQPSKLVRQRCAVSVCATAWIISIIVSLRNATKLNIDGEPVCVTGDEMSYYLQVSLLFFLPLVIIIFCFFAILKTVVQFSNRQRHRTVVVVLCIVAAFFICWAPDVILQLVSSFHVPENCYEQKRLNIAHNICRILAFSHCCMKPLLYMLSQNLRRHLLHFLRCDNVRNSNMERDASNSEIGSQIHAVMEEIESK